MATWKVPAVSAELTGNGVVFTKGNNHLLSNLRDSTILCHYIGLSGHGNAVLEFRFDFKSSRA
jgi:hypothetical protein